MGLWKKGEGLTEDIMKRIESFFEKGMMEKHVIPLSGIRRSTWYSWKKYAREIEAKLNNGELTIYKLKVDDIKMLKFLDICKKGQATLLYNCMDNIITAGKENNHWQANAWIMERLDPESFGKKQEIQHSGAIGHFDVELNEEDEKFFQENIRSMFPNLGDENGTED